jgi:molybdopterin-guanine dinucleotide biosynthesis protein A
VDSNRTATNNDSTGAEAFVLAGGISSRMGTEKGLLEIGGVPLILQTVRLVEPLVRSLTIIGPPDKYAELGVRVIPDRDFGIPTDDGKSKGPLFGIGTGLANSESDWNLILACDLPYLTRDWLELLLARAEKSNAQVVVPRTDYGLEPMAAVYRRECVGVIESLLARGVRRATEALRNLRLEVFEQQEWISLDPSGLVLKNMNTLTDYESARKWWNSRRDP